MEHEIRRETPEVTTACLVESPSLLGAIPVLPFKAPADAGYGSLRARLEQAGRLIGANDLLIAAQTLSLGYILVSDNEREFARIVDLRLENWLR